MALSVLQIHTKRFQKHKLEHKATGHQLLQKEAQNQDLIIPVQFHQMLLPAHLSKEHQ